MVNSKKPSSKEKGFFSKSDLKRFPYTAMKSVVKKSGGVCLSARIKHTRAGPASRGH